MSSKSFIITGIVYILAAVFSYTYINAQTQDKKVEFWKLTKKYDSARNVTVVSGNIGLFITRVREVCYDSDAEGFSLNTGHLLLSSSSSEVVNYVGSCFLGTNCEYTFSDSDGYLNIKDGSNSIYVLVRSSLQNGANAKLLTDTERVSSSGSQPVYSAGDYTGSGISGSNSNSSGTNNRPKDFECPYCKGTGKVKKTIDVAGYGIKDEYWTCPECGERSLTRHSHIHCSHCSGTGRIKY